MAEEKQNHVSDKTDEEEEVPLISETSEEENSESAFGRLGNKMNPVVFLLFMIFAMVVLLIVVSLKRSSSSASDPVQPEDPAIAALRADVEARRLELNRQRLAMNLPPIEGSSEPVEDIANRLKNDADTLVGLAGSFRQMLAEKDAEVSQRNSEILRLEKLRQDISMENSRLQTELQRALIGGSEAEQLKTLLSRVQAERDALAAQLATARQQLAEKQSAVDGEKFADLQRRFDETLRAKDFYEARARDLEAELTKTKLFAESVDELLPAAVELFRRLRKLEGLMDPDLTTEYSKLDGDLGASVLHTLDFSTGSSELSEADKRQIARIVAEEVPEDELALIVGYASKTGDSVANEKLSSDRATNAAEFFAKIKKTEQRVQAVYLGQTDRFSSSIPERNQICEIWKIRKK